MTPPDPDLRKERGLKVVTSLMPNMPPRPTTQQQCTHASKEHHQQKKLTISKPLRQFKGGQLPENPTAMEKRGANIRGGVC